MQITNHPGARVEDPCPSHETTMSRTIQKNTKGGKDRHRKKKENENERQKRKKRKKKVA